MQRRILFVFFGKLVEAIVVLHAAVYTGRIGFLDPGLTQLPPLTRGVFILYVARELD